MNLSVVSTEIAGIEDDGIQVAYDPEDPSYVAPLGETAVVVQADNSKGLIAMATILGVLVVVLTLFVMIAARFLVRQNTNR